MISGRAARAPRIPSNLNVCYRVPAPISSFSRFQFRRPLSQVVRAGTRSQNLQLTAVQKPFSYVRYVRLFRYFGMSKPNTSECSYALGKGRLQGGGEGGGQQGPVPFAPFESMLQKCVLAIAPCRLESKMVLSPCRCCFRVMPFATTQRIACFKALLSLWRRANDAQQNAFAARNSALQGLLQNDVFGRHGIVLVLL